MVAMKVNALDHVNIITGDLDGTATFFSDVLGLTRGDAPKPLTPLQAQWMFNDAGKPLVHINSLDCPRTFDREVQPGPTGSIHHVALGCTGYDEVTKRLNDRGLAHQINNIVAIGLRQIFVMEPNGVLLELNFHAD